MRHRIFRPLSTTGSSDHVIDFRHLAQEIFNPMVKAIDLLERSLRGEHGLQQERAFVQRGHEVAAYDERQPNRRTAQQDGNKRDETGMP